MLLFAVAYSGVLDDPAFRFCHENRAFTYNESLCPLLAEVPEGACEGLRAFCADPEGAPPAGCSEQLLTDGPLSSSSSDDVETPTPWEPPSWDLGGCSTEVDGAGSVLAWFVAFLVAGILGVLSVAVLRGLGLRRPDDLASVQIVSLTDEEDAHSFLEAVDDVPDLPPDGLLARAREALESGDLGGSAWLARGAVLRSLGERGELRLHRARTDREYVRQLEGTRRGPLKQVLGLAEQHRWGQVPLDRAQVESGLAAAVKLLAPVVLLWIGAPAWADERFGPAGDVALRRLVEMHASDVRFHRGGIGTPGDPGALFLDTTAVAPTDEDWEGVLEWVEEGNLLVVAGAFEPWGERVAAGTPCTSWLGTVPATGSEPLGYTDGDGWVTCVYAQPVATSSWGDGFVVGIADPLLFWNGAMVEPRNEAFWMALLGELETQGWLEPSVRLATWGQASDTPPSQALANLNLLPFALQVLVLWGAVVMWKGRRFGRPSEGDGLEERPFVEHVEAMAEHYRRLQADQHVARAFARYLLATHRAEGLQQEALRHGMERDVARDLVDRAEALAEGVDVDSPLETLEELWKITRPPT